VTYSLPPWIWDAIDKWSLWRGLLVASAADTPGHQKIIKVSGHNGFRGCRFCHISGCKCTPNGNPQYFPTRTPQLTPEGNVSFLNSKRPVIYNLPFPFRNQADLELALLQLDKCTTVQQNAAVRRETGIGGMSSILSQPAVTFPWSFPPDPFHRDYEDSMKTLFSIILTSKVLDKFFLSSDKAAILGKRIAQNNANLPSSFCGPIRDPVLFKNLSSKYTSELLYCIGIEFRC